MVVTATALPLVHSRSGRAAARLAVAVRDHRVPAGDAVRKQQVAGGVNDTPRLDSMLDVKVWEDEMKPPKRPVYNHPIWPFHDAAPDRAAPPDIAVQIYNRGTMPTMLAKLPSGRSVGQVSAWASDALEGFTC